MQDFPGGPLVKNLPAGAEDMGSQRMETWVPSMKIPRAVWQLSPGSRNKRIRSSLKTDHQNYRVACPRATRGSP